jgi:hypothetical protein
VDSTADDRALELSPQRVDGPLFDKDAGVDKVVRAVSRLRKEGDPAGALELLSAYRREYPRGMLAEEALALSIEASAALDDRQARALAEEYIRLYPHGRFVTTAEKAKARFGD